MKTAFLFAGQGSQSVGMATSLVQACDDCAATLAAADRALGYSLSGIMARGPEDDLRRTAIAQPAIVTLSVMHARHLMSLGVAPDYLLGHSVGQISAYVIANSLSFEAAVKLAAERGRLMQETVPEGEGAMMAIVNLERDRVYALCAAARPLGTVNVACHNAPRQTVVSGAVAAVEAVADACEEEGGSAIWLDVSAPFHCDLLAPVVPALERIVSEIAFALPAVPIVDNVTARPLLDARSVRQSLLDLTLSPVRFEEDLHYLVDRECGRFIQCGPGKALLGFAKKVAPEIVTETFEQAVQAVGAVT